MCIRDRDYYDVPMNNGERTGVNVVFSPQDGNNGGSTIDPVDPVDPVDPIDPVDPVDPVDNGGTNDTGRDDCPPNCILGDDIEDTKAEEESLIGPGTLLLLIVIILLAAIGILTRETEEEKVFSEDQTVLIEKEWESESLQFVPDMPPLSPPPGGKLEEE